MLGATMDLPISDSPNVHQTLQLPPELIEMTFAPSLAAASIAATLSEKGQPTLMSIGTATGPPMPAAPVPLFRLASATLALAFPCQGHDAPPEHGEGFAPPACPGPPVVSPSIMYFGKSDFPTTPLCVWHSESYW